MNAHSLPLPLFEPVADAWALPSPCPTTLIALWPGAKPPMMESLAEALFERCPGIQFVGEMSSAPDDALWTMVVDLPAPIAGRAIVFAELAKPLNADELDADARACAHVVGLELLLQRSDALAAFTEAMRLLLAAVPDAPAILDVAAGTWHRSTALAAIFADATGEPPEWLMWSVQVVSARREPAHDDSDDRVWIRTAGLWRCGLPELEILDLPAANVHAAVTLIQAIAGLMLDSPPAPPGERWNVGHEIDVTLTPWQHVVTRLDPSKPGSLASRRLDESSLRSRSLAHPLGGVRAVVCEPWDDVAGGLAAAEGSSGAGASWPVSALRRIVSGDAALWRSTQSIERLRRAAQRSWPRFVEACRRAPRAADSVDAPSPSRALVQATFDRGEDREHRWLEVLECDERRVVGRPLHADASRVAAAEPVTLDAARVLDWHLRVGDRMFTPDDFAGIDGVDGSR